MKASDYCKACPASFAFVATNSICQGVQVALLWPHILGSGQNIFFAYTSFKWANLASYNAGVSVVIIGVSSEIKRKKDFISLRKMKKFRKVRRI